ncbi:MAG: baseplate J/gp47 family protein [Janthinobacterium svalbardensis]|uniref:Baseplate assembly protein n=1 Tax=Janthinobacterium svalbardensis TaxID=368607 RepID=A0A290WU58_9BURK|nr:baseplate J/gp47 family protein [Janthinobacterium svalbardensis]ATD60414.1 baseplate assembly protein [Janthinobacterium svalbardensis]
MSTIDLSLLPAPSIVEVLSFEAIYAERKAALVAHFPASQQDAIARALEIESEPMAKLLQENPYRELVWRQRVNDGARALMLAFASGTDLDQLAANVNLTRLVTVQQLDADTSVTTVETDTLLRERIQLAFEGLSVAGPRNAYVKHARDADARVADISAISPEPCEVVVTVLSNVGDGIASDELLAVVHAALSDEDVRPLGDRLSVQSADIVHFTIRATLYLDAHPEAEPILQSAGERTAAYAAERRRLGRDVNRSAIIAALHAEGVKKVVLHEPADDIAVADMQAAYCDGIDIANGGARG